MCVTTTLLGISGSLVGRLIGRLFSKSESGATFHPAGFILSIIGAIILLLFGKIGAGLTRGLFLSTFAALRRNSRVKEVTEQPTEQTQGVVRNEAFRSTNAATIPTRKKPTIWISM
jgi:uncharacterized membrane protein YeaQ/YmgE (transglycosylase-associated protein family)